MIIFLRYFCLKEGKCFGTTCKGCIKHECEINKKKTIITVPDDYISKNLESANRVLAKDINVEDKTDGKAVEKWCTMLKVFISITKNEFQSLEKRCLFKIIALGSVKVQRNMHFFWR